MLQFLSRRKKNTLIGEILKETPMYWAEGGVLWIQSSAQGSFFQTRFQHDNLALVIGGNIWKNVMKNSTDGASTSQIRRPNLGARRISSLENQRKSSNLWLAEARIPELWLHCQARTYLLLFQFQIVPYIIFHSTQTTLLSTMRDKKPCRSNKNDINQHKQQYNA